MKGSEKQVRWAEDIIRNTREALKGHMDWAKKEAEAHPNMANEWNKSLHIWQAISAEFERTIAPIDSASVIIENRDCLSARRMQYYFDEIRMGYMRNFPGV